MDIKDYYQILNVTSTSTQDEIKSSYRKLVRDYHPDMAETNHLTSDEAQTKMSELNEAYDVLKDPQKRQVYDQNRAYSEFFQKQNPVENSKDKYKFQELKTFYLFLLLTVVSIGFKFFQNESAKPADNIRSNGVYQAKDNKEDYCDKISEKYKDNKELAQKVCDEVVKNFQQNINIQLREHRSNTLRPNYMHINPSNIRRESHKTRVNTPSKLTSEKARQRIEGTSEDAGSSVLSPFMIKQKSEDSVNTSSKPTSEKARQRIEGTSEDAGSSVLNPFMIKQESHEESVNTSNKPLPEKARQRIKDASEDVGSSVLNPSMIKQESHEESVNTSSKPTPTKTHQRIKGTSEDVGSSQMTPVGSDDTNQKNKVISPTKQITKQDDK